MKKKSIALMAIAVLMVASIATAVTLAYFTDKDEKINTFTVGNVDIELQEPSWKDIPSKQILPNVPVEKDPYVVNKSANAAYIRMKVTITNADVFSQGEAYKILGKTDPNWTLVNETAKPDEKTHMITYIYTYNKPLQGVNDVTSKLFTHVTLPGEFTNTDMKNLNSNGGFKITVTAEAIQADGFTASNEYKTPADAAFAALNAKAAEAAS